MSRKKKKKTSISSHSTAQTKDRGILDWIFQQRRGGDGGKERIEGIDIVEYKYIIIVYPFVTMFVTRWLKWFWYSKPYADEHQ